MTNNNDIITIRGGYMKRAISFILCVIVSLCCFTSLSTVAQALSKSEFDSKLEYLRTKYRNYDTWDNWFDGGSQCFGFARLMGYEVFGSYPSTWEVSNDFYSVKVGDIVRYGNTGSGGHSIFVTSVSGNTIKFVDCNGNGNYMGSTEVRSCGIKWDNTAIIGGDLFGFRFSYIRKSPKLEENHPVANAWLKVASSTIISGDNQNFYFGADNASGTYTLGIDYGNTRIFTENITGGSYSTMFTTTGNFSAYITAYGEGGHVDSNRVYFTVVKRAPATNAWITADKTNIIKSQSVTFRYGANDSAGLYTIGIDKDSKRIYTDTTNNNTYTYTFNDSGDYSVYVTCYGYDGSADTEKIHIIVSEPLPALNAWIKANKTIVKTNQSVIFNFGAENSAGLYTIGIDKEGKRIFTETMQNSSYEYTFKQAGTYSVYVTCYGYAGFSDTEKIYIRVLDTNYLGDANSDGIINVEDATSIQKYIVGLFSLDEENIINLDVNFDGKIDVLDATLIQKFCVKLIHEF